MNSLERIMKITHPHPDLNANIKQIAQSIAHPPAQT